MLLYVLEAAGWDDPQPCIRAFNCRQEAEDLIRCEKIVVSHEIPAEAELPAILAEWKQVGKRYSPETINKRNIILLWPGLPVNMQGYAGPLKFKENEQLRED